MEKQFSFAKFTEKRKQRYLGAIRQGCNKAESARMAGCSCEIIRLYTRANPEFATAVNDAEIDSLAPVESTLRRKALEGNMTAMIFLLTNRDNERWKDRRNWTPVTSTQDNNEATVLKLILERLQAQANNGTPLMQIARNGSN